MAYTVYNFQDNNDVKKIAEKGQFSVVEWQRDLSVSPWSAQTAWFSSEMNVRRRQLIANLDGRTGVTLQAGAMQWTVGSGEVTVEGTTLRFGAYQHEDKTANNWDGHGRFVASLNKDGTVNLDAEAVTSLSLNNAAFDLYNEYQDTVNLKGWKASGDSFLHVDVDVENLTADC